MGAIFAGASLTYVNVKVIFIPSAPAIRCSRSTPTDTSACSIREITFCEIFAILANPVWESPFALRWECTFMAILIFRDSSSQALRKAGSFRRSWR